MGFNFEGFFRFIYLWLFRVPWTRRRALVAAAFLLYVPLELIVHLGLSLDALLYPGYRSRRVAQPVFITGNPRSGTTLLHRLLARDTQRFSTMCMWEILFAPSIVQRRVVWALGALERRMGAPVRRLWQRVERRWAAINVMHRVSLSAPEEDDYLLLHSWSALTTGLSAGLLDEARPYTYFDSALPKGRRACVMRFYRRCVQRHLQAEVLRHGSRSEARSYLAKNPALCPKLDSVLEEFSDARVIYLVRNPLDVVPSYLSMMLSSWRSVGVPGDPAELRDYLLDMAGHWYRYPLERLAREPVERYTIVRYDDLVGDPQGTVSAIYSRFGWSMGSTFAATLCAEAARARQFRSRHEYAPERLGLTRERILVEFRDVFERFDFPLPYASERPSSADAGERRVGARRAQAGAGGLHGPPGRSSLSASTGPHEPGAYG